MSRDVQKFLELQKEYLLKEKLRLGLVEYADEQRTAPEDDPRDAKETDDSYCRQVEDDKENVFDPSSSDAITSQSVPLVEPLNLGSKGALERDKQSFVDRLVNSESPLPGQSNDGTKCAMLRCGEYSPNNPHFRVTAAPYVGLGEYEQRKRLYSKQLRAEYIQHLTKKNDKIRNVLKDIQPQSPPSSSRSVDRYVQTDIQNIHNKLVQYELHSQIPPEKELCPEDVDAIDMHHRHRSSYSSNPVDQRLTSAQNSLGDKPKSILSKRYESPRVLDRYSTDMPHSYVPSFMDGFSYQEDNEVRRREQIKRETYNSELRMQIEEKRRLTAMMDEQERRTQDLANRRLEQQLMRMQEEQMAADERRNRREEQLRRNSEEYTHRQHDLRSSLRKHTESESSLMNTRNNTDVASKSYSHYSPPTTRRNPYSLNVPANSAFSDRYTPNPGRYDSLPRRDVLNKLDSLTSSAYNSIGRYDSLSRIDTLNRQDALSRRFDTLSLNDGSVHVRRHSATHQDVGLKRSPKLQRRSSSSRFDDGLPIPVLKAHSPVAKELRNSVAVNSTRSSSEALRRLEDKWQVPAVQKNFYTYGSRNQDGESSRGVLTQLGAIRMQLQQEQMRMDEVLRQRGVTQSKAVDFH